MAISMLTIRDRLDTESSRIRRFYEHRFRPDSLLVEAIKAKSQ